MSILIGPVVVLLLWIWMLHGRIERIEKHLGISYKPKENPDA